MMRNLRILAGFAGIGVEHWARLQGILLGLALILTPVMAVEELIVVVKRQATDQPFAAPSGTSQPKTLKEIYDRWYNFPGQVYIDSPSGPVPLLGNDLVYDANGYPVPRLPDPFTYAVITNPNDNEALKRYLDWKLAFVRRSRIAMNRVPDFAVELGYVQPDTVAVGKARPTDQKLLGDMRAIEKDSLGQPIVSAGRARELGIAQDEIPKLPGEATPAGVEVYWFWWHRCSHCQAMARTWFAFQRSVNDAGYKAMSINVAPLRNDAEVESASVETAAILEVWTIPWGEDVQYSKNTLDWLDSANSFNVTGTPVVLLINRNTLLMKRLEGPQDDTSLRTALAEVGGWDAGIWPPPKAVDVQRGIEGKPAPSQPVESPANTSPLPWLKRAEP